MLYRLFFQLWYEKRFIPLLIFLFPLSFLYLLVWKIVDIYYTFLKKPFKLPCPVISVGNITLGGTGKTPFIAYLVEILLRYNYKKVVILTRGYKGKKLGVIQDVDGEPDESRILKRNYPQITILANPNRKKVFIDYFSNEIKPDIVILDDGFQHRKIYRDLDIIMVDGKLMFGNKFIFPAGPLREPLISIIRRADILVFKNSKDPLEKFFGKPAFAFNIKNIKLFDKYSKEIEKDKLISKNIIAFCGIGNPNDFKNTLVSNGFDIKFFFAFPDHYNYTKKDIANISKKGSKETIFLTSEKDWVKISNIWPEDLEIYVVKPFFCVNNEEELLRCINEKIHFPR
jgi:tetraacyldisaccharide 4'-kinase